MKLIAVETSTDACSAALFIDGDIREKFALMVCDPRLLKRSYGQMFLDSVPAMKRSRELEDVKHFFARESNA